MKLTNASIVLSSILFLLLSSCEKYDFEGLSGMGKKPVYLPLSELGNIRNLPPQPVELSGTIFLRDTLFFMLEQKKGIHVFNIKDTLNPVSLTFFSIPAIADFTISGNRLYADSWKDLVTVDISDLMRIREFSRKTDVFAPPLFPPLYNGIFECVDPAKGAVVGWADAPLEHVRCQTVN
ncbi:MAG: hypothetical protein IPH16_02140 [Haliscomenobacter sp.]|nr:hypothetical protein [Haliscomenobacter sp.]